LAKRLLLRDAENISADMLQRILGGLFWRTVTPGGIGSGFTPGVVGSAPTATTGHMATIADGVTMVLTILPGWAFAVRDAGGSTYDPRTMMAESDANDSVTITANATGSTRNDTVCLKIDMNTAPASDGANLVSFVALAGASGGGLPNAPADGNLYLPLANVAVANGAAFISQGNVSDLRSALIATPGGTLPNGYKQVIANQGSITGTVDLTGLTTTVTLAAGRRIKITAQAFFESTVGADSAVLSIVEGATVLQQGAIDLQVANALYSVTAQAILTPTAGSHTYKLQAARGTGTGTLTMFASPVSPAFILVEDIGV